MRAATLERYGPALARVKAMYQVGVTSVMCGADAPGSEREAWRTSGVT